MSVRETTPPFLSFSDYRRFLKDANDESKKVKLMFEDANGKTQKYSVPRVFNDGSPVALVLHVCSHYEQLRRLTLDDESLFTQIAKGMDLTHSGEWADEYKAVPDGTALDMDQWTALSRRFFRDKISEHAASTLRNYLFGGFEMPRHSRINHIKAFISLGSFALTIISQQAALSEQEQKIGFYNVMLLEDCEAFEAPANRTVMDTAPGEIFTFMAAREVLQLQRGCLSNHGQQRNGSPSPNR